MPEFRILLTDYAWSDVEIERRELAAIDGELIVAPAANTETLAQLASQHQVDAILTCWAQVPAEVIDASPRLRIVSRLGIGLDNIDVPHCTARRIVVTNVPDYCLDEVAEHALALILALGRKVAFYDGQVKAGRYDLAAGPPLRRLRGQTLGIVGLGSIGRALAARAVPLGFRVLAASRTRREPPPGVAWCTLEALLAESDYVSLHVPSLPETQHLINARTLALMKPTACLINTARGALVDETALLAALEADCLAGAALDVQQQEPPNLRQPLYRHPRVIVTPHAAFCSVESLADLRTRATRQVVDLLAGRQPANIVNPHGIRGA